MYSKKKSGFTNLLFIIGVFALFLVATQISYGLTPYDNFSNPAIDVSKWNQNDYAREIWDGQLRLKTRSSANSTGTTDTNIRFQNPASINSMEAKVTPMALDNPQGARLTAYMGGLFFNDGTEGRAPGLFTGDIFAYVGVGGSTPPTLHWFVLRYVHPTDPTKTEVVGFGDFDLVPAVGTQYTFSVSWDGPSFTFKVSDGFTTEEVPFNHGLAVEDANMPAKWIAARISSNAGREALIETLIDDVKINGSLYDDFSGDTIDTTKWRTNDGVNDYVRDIYNEALRLKVRTSEADTNTIQWNQVNMSSTKLPDVVQANVTLRDYSNPNGMYLRAGVSGEYYNDGTNKDWEGEVSANVAVGGTGEDPVAYWNVVRHTDQTDPNQIAILASGDFTTPITLNTAYTLLLGWDGTMFTFKIDDEEATYTPTTKIKKVIHPTRKLQIRVLNPDTQESLKESLIDATFDDVMVGSSSPPKQYRLKVIASAAKKGGGVVKSTDDLISCGDGGSCANMYTEGTPVVLEAIPNEGSVFAGWTPVSLGCGTEPTCEVILNKNTTVKAKFVGPNKLKVKVASKKGGVGTVTSNITGLDGESINCPATLCENYYTLTDTVTLTAAPQGDSAFLGWKPTSLGCGVNFTCEVPMDRTRNIQAVFGPQAP